MIQHASPIPVRPPSRHELAAVIWLAVFPTLTVLNLTLGGWLRPMAVVPRTLVLATLAVPIVMYGVMPQLLRARAALLGARVIRAAGSAAPAAPRAAGPGRHGRLGR